MKRQRARRPRGVAPVATLDALEDSTAQKPASRRGLFAAFTAVLLVATFAAYWPSLSAGFIWDDDDYVTNNVAIRSSSGLVSIWTKPGTTVQYYPMVFTTFWLEYRMWNLNPAGYHATNILLHALCALLFSLVLRQLGVPGAVLSAFAFALHPVCVESVAWVTERKNVLSTVFYLSSALVFLKTYDLEKGGLRNPRRWRWYVVSLVLFTLALLSKTVTCTLPVAILIVIWWKRGRLLLRDFLFVLPMLSLGAALGAMTIWMEQHVVGARHIDLGLSIPGRFAVAGRAIYFYLSKLVWPAGLTFIYPRWTVEMDPGWQLAVPVSVAAAICVLGALRHRLGRSPAATLLLFIVTLSPALGFVDVFPMRYSFVADHFQYLAMLSPLALGGALLARAGQERALRFLPGWARLAGLAAVGLILAVLTNRQSRVYADPQTLWADTLKKNPSAWLAHNNLGHILLQQGKAADALRHFEEALRLNPESVEAMVSLGFARAGAGELEEAVRLYRRALEIWPSNSLCLTNLGAALHRQGKLEEAKDAFWRALDARPDRAEHHRNLGLVLAQTGELERAITGYEQAVKRAPRNVLFRVEFARLLARAGRPGESREHYLIARSTAVEEADFGAVDTIDREVADLGR